jgi:uncharacterized protein YyaL (SSP411 family)
VTAEPKLEADGAQPRPNRLSDATSPYLLQHAHNPVDWYPWGDAAFARARVEDKPVLLSIGYSSCHWCHVMAHESFEDQATADLLNEYFVCIKVDREERPDIDEVYMTATLAMTGGNGGWPMTVFMTPTAEPFFAGTYFPVSDRWGRPGFTTVLRRVAEMWRTNRVALLRQADEVVQHLRAHAGARAPGELDEGTLKRALEQAQEDFDPRHGGFGGAPKFPSATTILLLLRLWRRFDSSQALEMARATLEAMARGGIYDQIGGGFHRYATDERWLVPHFEKMLYDNALLAKAYLEGWQATKEPLFRRVAVETLDYVLRDMRAPEGGFYSATDADSEGEEGRYFVWTPQQVREALGDAEEARRFCAYYDISASGNWEGVSVPNRLDPEHVVAWRAGEASDVVGRAAEAARPRVLAARARRVAPGLDDKILTSWNGLMIGALAEGFRVLGEPRYLAAALGAADFVRTALTSSDGGLLRTYRAGRAHVAGFLEDYAYFGEGLVDLYEAGAGQVYLEQALVLSERLLREFPTAEGAFCSTSASHESLIWRASEGHDGATPSANATAAHVLARLSAHFGRSDLRDAALRALSAHGGRVARQPRACAKSLIALDWLTGGPLELVFVGSAGRADYEALWRGLGDHLVARRVVAHLEPACGSGRLPLLSGKGLVDGKAALFACRTGTCLPPIVDPADIASALARV